MFLFPFTSLHELNLDWLLDKVKTLVANNEEFNTKADYAVETADEAKTIATQAAAATIADGAVTTIKLADEAVTTAKLAPLSVTTSKIQLGAVNETAIAAGAVTSAKIADGTIVAADLADGAVTSNKINDGAVTSAKIADGTIVAADLADGAVTTAKIDDGAVTTAKIDDGAVTTAKIDAGAVTNAKIADSAVSYVKLDSTAKNDSGEGYCKMPDGTMIEWGTYKTTAISTTQTGSVYMATLSPDITFPVPFYQDAPKVFLNQYGGYGSIWACNYNISGINSIDMARPTSGTITPDVSWLAIGKWK